MAIHCQNCGAQVSKTYARVRARNPDDGPRACPQCPDIIWDTDGTIRDARSNRRTDTPSG